MNRLMLVVMIATAVCMHCTFCEWDICEHEKIVPEWRHDRVIYHDYRTAYDTDVYLMSRSGASRDDAQLYGLGIPLLVFGAAVVVLRMDGGGTKG